MTDLCWAYTIVRNEAKMLPWWLRWYTSFCERVIVYDDASDDGTHELAHAAGAEVRGLPFAGLDDGSMVRFAEQTYPEARGEARWVAWVDADELIADPAGNPPLELLVGLRALGVRLPTVEGWQMYSDHLPEPTKWREQLPQLVTSGLTDDHYSKQIIFDPGLALNFGLGRHSTHGAESQPSPLRLLHFRFMGRQYYLERSARNYARLSDRAKEHGWGGATYPDAREAEADMNEARAKEAARA